MSSVLAIVGTYRKGGVTDRLSDAVLQAAADAGARTEKIYLIDKTIQYCTNCRTCTQQPGEQPGQCVIEDDMAEILEKIQAADALVLAAPTNFFNVTAVFRAFMERTVGYAYWPWEKGAPGHRVKSGRRGKKAVLITASAAPTLLGRFAFRSLKALKTTATVLGAKPIGSIYVGLAAREPEIELPAAAVKKATRLGQRLA